MFANELFFKAITLSALVGSRRRGELHTDTVTGWSCYSNCVSKQLSIYTSQIPAALAFIWLHMCDNPADLRQIFVLMLCFWILQTASLKKKCPKRTKMWPLAVQPPRLSEVCFCQATKGRLKGTSYWLPAPSDLTCITKEYAHHFSTKNDKNMKLLMLEEKSTLCACWGLKLTRKTLNRWPPIILCHQCIIVMGMDPIVLNGYIFEVWLFICKESDVPHLIITFQSHK